MKSIRPSIYNYIKIAGLKATLLATVAGAVYLLLMKHPDLILKTNRTQTILTTRKHMLPFLWEGAKVYFFNTYLPTWQKGIEPTLAEKKE